MGFVSLLFIELVLAVFLLVARRRCYACSVSLRSSLFVLPHASLLFCPFQFIRFLSHAALLLFVLVVAFFVSCSFLFLPLSPLSLFTGLWVFFPLARLSSIFRFLCHSTFTPLHAWFFRFFCQFRYRIICLCVQCPFCSVSCVFHFWPLLLFVAFGISRFCPFGPSWAAHCRFVRARA